MPRPVPYRIFADRHWPPDGGCNRLTPFALCASPPFMTDFGWSPLDFSSGSCTLDFVCVSGDDARDLAAQFDHEQFLSQLNAIAGPAAPASNRVLKDFSVNVARSQNIFFIKYDFSPWGRYRLDARHMAYVFDRNDPAAESRNAAVHGTFQQAGEAFAQRNPVIQKWSHLP